MLPHEDGVGSWEAAFRHVCGGNDTQTQATPLQFLYVMPPGTRPILGWVTKNGGS